MLAFTHSCIPMINHLWYNLSILYPGLLQRISFNRQSTASRLPGIPDISPCSESLLHTQRPAPRQEGLHHDLLGFWHCSPIRVRLCPLCIRFPAAILGA